MTKLVYLIVGMFVLFWIPTLAYALKHAIPYNIKPEKNKKYTTRGRRKKGSEREGGRP